MAIEYVEIRNQNTDLIGIIDTAQSIIWRSVYYGVGDFEIYVKASPEAIALLQAGNYVTRPDDVEVGIVERINISDDPHDGTMLTATGRFAKSLLERRLIYSLSGNVNTPTILRGNVETEVRRLVQENAISCIFDSNRNMPILALGALSNIPLVIVDDNGQATQKQVSCENLLTYTDAVLQEYGLGATVILDAGARQLQYVVYAGVDRSENNADGNVPLVFSKEFDNLTTSSYTYDAATEKNAALIGGAGEGVERFYSLLANDKAGLQRREMWVDASSLNRQYKDADDVERTYSDAEYRAMLDAAGKLNLHTHKAAEEFVGALDVMNSQWIYNRDFALGDIVTTQNNSLEKFVNVRILDILEAQDENGYTIEANTQS